MLIHIISHLENYRRGSRKKYTSNKLLSVSYCSIYTPVRGFIRLAEKKDWDGESSGNIGQSNGEGDSYQHVFYLRI